MHLEQKLDALKDLLQFAISKNLPVDEKTIVTVNSLLAEQQQYRHDVTVPEKGFEDIETRADLAIQKITSITYPTTIETIVYSSKGESNNVIKIIYVTAPIVICLTIIAYANGSGGSANKLWDACLAIFLGMLGSLVYSFFHILGLYTEKAVSSLDKNQVWCRLILGAILGFFFYFTWGRDAFNTILRSVNGIDTKTALLLAFPFLAGYSTKLVFGVLDQMVSMIELTLGLDNRKKELLKKASS